MVTAQASVGSTRSEPQQEQSLQKSSVSAVPFPPSVQGPARPLSSHKNTTEI
nr:MAG TPA: hypothetical protein [Caudoviricetes sp.]